MHKKLIQMATEASKNSHSPYSGKKVGAAVLWSDGSMSAGTNIENASYGGTICAERVAIVKRISEANQLKIEKVAVYIDEPQAWPPCGMCRQVIAEFCTDTTEIICSNGRGHEVTLSFKDIFPGAFSPAFLRN